MRRALQAYVDFDRAGDDAERDTRPATPDTVSVNGGLRKGLTVIQVERILGPATKVNDRTEGAVDMNIREYSTEDEHINCQFVGGVLINYQVTPRGR